MRDELMAARLKASSEYSRKLSLFDRNRGIATREAYARLRHEVDEAGLDVMRADTDFKRHVLEHGCQGRSPLSGSTGFLLPVVNE
jgi:hypothetical protein